MIRDDTTHALAPVDEARRRFLVRALESGLLIGGLGWSATALAGPFGRRPARLPEGRSIFDLRGEVLVNGRPADQATLIQAGDEVRVGRGGQAIFAVGDSAYILRERSLLRTGGRKLVVESLRLLSGGLLGVFGRRRAQNPLLLRTRTATIGVRGTGLYVEARPDRTYVCNCYGIIDIAAAGAPGVEETIESEHHDAPRWVLGGDGTPAAILPAPFLYHTDLELSTIEALVGRDVPFGMTRSRYRGPRRTY